MPKQNVARCHEKPVSALTLLVERDRQVLRLIRGGEYPVIPLLRKEEDCCNRATD